MRKQIVYAVAVASLLVSTGCASVQRAPVERDLAAKEFQPPPKDKANLYIFRDETYGGNWAATVLVDGKLLGDTVHHTFFLTQVEPGPHTVMSKAENDTQVSFVAEAGKNHFIWQEMKMGMWRARATLHIVDEERGMTGVSRCKLVQTQQYSSR